MSYDLSAFHFICDFGTFSAGIKEIYADPNGTRAVLIDVKGSGYIYRYVHWVT